MTDEKIRKRLRKKLLLGIITGVVLFLFGIFRFWFFPPNIAINLYYKMPEIANGTIPIVMGLILIFGCYLSLRKIDKIIHQEIKDLEAEKKEKRNQPKYLKHY